MIIDYEVLGFLRSVSFSYFFPVIFDYVATMNGS